MEKNSCHCPRENTFKVRDIARLIWEEHHHDYSKSIFNPKMQYQALFLIKKKEIEEEKIENTEAQKKKEREGEDNFTNIKRICFPKDWMLRGEDIIDININNVSSPFFECIFQEKEKHLVIDLDRSLSSDDSFYFIANYQDIWRSKVVAFSDFLSRLFNNLKSESQTRIKINSQINEEEKRERSKYFKKKINTDNLEKAYVKKNLSQGKKHIFHYLLFCKPLDLINIVDYWIKIPSICEIEKSRIWKANSEKTCELITDICYLDILSVRKLKKILPNVPEINEIKKSGLQKVKEKYDKTVENLKINKDRIAEISTKILKYNNKNENLEITDFKIKKISDIILKYGYKANENSDYYIKEIINMLLKKDGNEIKDKDAYNSDIETILKKLDPNVKQEMENLLKDGYKEVKPLRYQSSELEQTLYQRRIKNLNTNFLIRKVIKFKREILRWYRFPIFLSIFQIILALGYLFFNDFIMYILPQINSWFFLTFSINILTLLLISLNWGTIKYLRLFKPKIYSKYMWYILISFFVLLSSIILQPFIKQIITFIINSFS